MHDDDPGDVVHDTFAQTVFGDTPLGRPILGTVDSIETLSRDTVRRYYKRWYRPEHMVVAAAGNLDHAAVVRLVKKCLRRRWRRRRRRRRDRPPPSVASSRRPCAGGDVAVISRATEQVNLVLGVPGVDRNDPRRFALGVLNSALGGGMSSRLFQEVREKRGLAYSVYSYHSQYSDAGLFGVYAGCLPKKVDDVLDLCRAELQRVCHRGITAEELDRGKGQLRGSLVLGMEDTGSRMNADRQERAGLRRDALARRGARAGSRRHPRRRAATWRPSCSAVEPTLAVIGPFDADRTSPVGGVVTVKVAVIGAAGRMGTETCRAVEAADDLELVARIDRDGSLQDAADAGAAGRRRLHRARCRDGEHRAGARARACTSWSAPAGSTTSGSRRCVHWSTQHPGSASSSPPTSRSARCCSCASHARRPRTSRPSRSSRRTTPTRSTPPAAPRSTPHGSIAQARARRRGGAGARCHRSASLDGARGADGRRRPRALGATAWCGGARRGRARQRRRDPDAAPRLARPRGLHARCAAGRPPGGRADPDSPSGSSRCSTCRLAARERPRPLAWVPGCRLRLLPAVHRAACLGADRQRRTGCRSSWAARCSCCRSSACGSSSASCSSAPHRRARPRAGRVRRAAGRRPAATPGGRVEREAADVRFAERQREVEQPPGRLGRVVPAGRRLRRRR